MNRFKGFISLMLSTLCGKSTNEQVEETSKNILLEEKKFDDPIKIVNSPPPSNVEGAERFLTISQAAKTNHVTRQAIYFAIKMKRLDAKKEGDTWLISSKDLKNYNKNKYSREKSRREGELIFDKDKGFHSISAVAKILRKSLNQVYYLVRVGRIKTHRQGAAIVVKESDLQDFLDIENKKPNKKMAV